jgi:hypothetical protein
MDKKQLLALGLTEEQVKNILAVYKTTLDETLTTYVSKSEIEKNYIDKKQYEEVNKQLKELTKFKGDSEELQTKLKTFEEANTKREVEYKEALTLERKQNAIKIALLESEDKPHDSDLVSKLFDLNLISVGDDGKIKTGLKEQMDTIKKEKAFLFKPVETPKESTDNNLWKPAGATPLEGKKPSGGSGNTFVDFGKSLASAKLSTMGIRTDVPTT